jgi:ATP/maltotriose-dependent transcriptional regulator MalT
MRRSRGRLVLASAPAGWGKSTLLAQWADALRDDHLVVFLSLDRWDSDPRRFRETMLEALHSKQLALELSLPSTPGAVGLGLDSFALASIFNQFAAVDHRVVLVPTLAGVPARSRKQSCWCVARSELSQLNSWQTQVRRIEGE